jgi:hypothetical protein
MANNKEQYLDRNGVSHFYLLIKNKLTTYFKTLFVSKKDGYDLSQNDFTNELKAKLENIDGSGGGDKVLGSDGKISIEYMPDLGIYDDVVEGYFNSEDNLFYEEEEFTTKITGENEKLYVGLNTNRSYRWSGSIFIQLESSTGLTALSNAEIDDIITSVDSSTE